MISNMAAGGISLLVISFFCTIPILAFFCFSGVSGTCREVDIAKVSIAIICLCAGLASVGVLLTIFGFANQ